MTNQDNIIEIDTGGDTVEYLAENIRNGKFIGVAWIAVTKEGRAYYGYTFSISNRLRIIGALQALVTKFCNCFLEEPSDD